MQLSFLIPALNEEKNIENCISSVKNFVPVEYSYEIVVADHGSADATAKLARSSGAIVFTKCGGTIAALRNELVAYSSGDLLVFIDADIRLTPQWQTNIEKIVAPATGDDVFISGSPCMPENSSTFLNKYWFYPLAEKKKNYIGTGHMIIPKVAYEQLNGFDENLSSGEDYDLCERAKGLNIPVISRGDLKVIHLDYPEKISAFVKREIWHGSGDCKSFKSFINSKIAIASSLYFSALLGLLISIITEHKLASSVFLAASLLLPTLMSFMKLRRLTIKDRVANIAICAVYLFARALSILVRGKEGRFYVTK